MKKFAFVIIILIIFMPAKANLNTTGDFDVYFPKYAIDELMKKFPAPGKKKLSTMEEKLFKEMMRQRERRIYWINTL